MPNYNSTLQTNNSSLEEIITQLNNLPNVEDLEPVLQDKTVSPRVIEQTITADSGYDGLGTITVGAMPTATQATPTVAINTTNGLITATAIQSTGYVTGGTKTATKQLTFQPAQTITPGTTDKTIAANTYLGGVQTIKGDANLVASNIISGKSIFGVMGTATAGGGGSSGDTNVEDMIITRTLTTYTNDRVTSIGNYAFAQCSRLTNVSFPACTRIGYSAFAQCISLTNVSFPVCTSISGWAFQSCFSLTNVSFPVCTSIDGWAFAQCSRLTNVSFPACTRIGYNAFAYCSSLTNVSFPVCTSIGDWAFVRCISLTNVSFPVCTSISGWAFQSCSKLASIYLANSSVCTLAKSNAFSGTGIWSDKGSIFVPSSLVASYKKATNWAFFSNRIFSYAF